MKPIKKMQKLTLNHIQELYRESDNCMTELLAITPAENLSIEEAFELYIKAMNYAEGDEFYIIRNDNPIEELTF